MVDGYIFSLLNVSEHLKSFSNELKNCKNSSEHYPEGIKMSGSSTIQLKPLKYKFMTSRYLGTRCLTAKALFDQLHFFRT